MQRLQVSSLDWTFFNFAPTTWVHSPRNCSVSNRICTHVVSGFSWVK
jgi:hypothetical protein